MNFANYVDDAARDRPDVAAVTDPRRELTFADLAAETDAFANALASLEVDPGERVALYLPNSVAFVVAHFGAMKRGAIPFPINMRFTGNEIEYVLEDAGASAVVTTGAFEGTIADLDADSVEHLVVVEGERGHDYRDLVGTADQRYDVHPRKNDELAELLYTSGTTGRPKGVKHTHGNLDANARATIRYWNYSQHDIALTAMPCFHTAGLNMTTAPFVITEATNHLLTEWDPEAALERIAERGVTVTAFAPTMLFDLLNHDSVEDYDTSSLRMIGTGGAPMPKDRISTVEETFDCTLLELYGLTEATLLAAVNRPDPAVRKPGSAGRPTAETTDVHLEDPETGERVDRGDPGEMLLHGDAVTPGYYRMPERNEEAFVRRDGRRWFRSGDIGRMDEDGHLYVVDRIDNMIISGGENVYPREVEDAIYGLDGVVEAAVIGLPDDRLGERVTAVVVRSSQSVTEDDIEQACRGEMAAFKIPRAVRFVDEMPKTSSKKIDKEALRERFS